MAMSEDRGTSRAIIEVGCPAITRMADGGAAERQPGGERDAEEGEDDEALVGQEAPEVL
ncbi:MAG: hypothetical protein H6739_25405 [Alphaproteobacteria bacterium]|nr:hypothetical protein [Alphaproteobacteria bacterium]